MSRHSARRLATSVSIAPNRPGRNPADRRYRPALELFEERLAPATVYWINPNGGDWAVPANWSTGRLPTAEDDVIIDPTGITVTHSQGSDTVLSLTSEATLHFTAGTLTLLSDSRLNGPLTMVGGNLTTSGLLVAAGPFSWTGGSFLGGGRLRAAGGLTISGTGTKGLDRIAVESTGATDWSQGNVSLSNGAAFHNLAGATFLARAGRSFIHITPGASPAFTNAGAFTSARSTTFDNVSFSNSGSVVVAPELAEDIILTLRGGGTSTGSFQVGPRGTLQFSSGVHQLLAGSAVTGVGTVEFLYEGSTVVNVTVAGTYQVPGSTRITAAGGSTFAVVVTFAADAALGSLNQSAGTLAGAGVVTIAHTFVWTGGTQAGPGRTVVNGTLTMSGGGSTVLNGRIIDNAGAATWTGGNVDVFAAAVFNNLAGATFDAQSGGTFGGFPPYGGQFNNVGTLRRSGASGTSTFTIPLNNSGQIDVATGTLKLSAGSTSGGTMAVAANAVLELGAGVHYFPPAARITGAGAIRFSDLGTSHIEGVYAVTGETTLSEGTVFFRRDVTFGRLTLQYNGVLDVTGDVTINGLLTWDSGLMSGPGRTRANGGVLGRFNGNYALSGRVFDNAGDAQWEGGSLSLGAGAVFNNLAGAVFSTLTDNIFRVAGDGTFNNFGTIGRPNPSRIEIAATFNNTGLVDLPQGGLTLEGISQNSSIYRVGSVRFGVGEHNLSPGSQLVGAVRVTFTGPTIVGGTYDVGTTVVGGMVTFLGDARTVTLEALGGPLTGPGTLTVTEYMLLSGGIVSGTGRLRVNGRLLSYGGRLEGRQLEVAGSVIFDGGTVSLGNGAVFRTLPGVTTELRYNVNIVASAGLPPRFLNGGTFRKTQGTGTSTFNGVFFENTGSVEVLEGTLSLAGGGTGTGTFLVVAGSTLSFNSGPYTLAPQALVTGAGTVSFANDRNLFNNRAVVEGTLQTTGPVTVSNTTVELRRDTRVAALTLAGNITGTANLAITGLFTWTTGTMSGLGQTVAEGGMRVAGTLDSQFLLDGRRLDNLGVAEWSPPRGVGARNGAVFTNRAGGTILLQSEYTIYGAVGAVLRNAGLIRYARIASATWTIPLENTGTVEVQSGQLQLENARFNSGIMTIASGATLELPVGDFVLHPTSRLTGQGTLLVLARNFPYNLTVHGVFDVNRVVTSQTNVRFEGNARIADASLGNATIAASAVLTVTQNLAWGTLRGLGRVVFSGRANLSGGTPSDLDGVTFDNAGTISVFGFSANAGILARNGAAFNNLAGAAFEFRNQGSFRWDLVGSIPRFHNTGLLRKAEGANEVVLAAAFSNAGSLEVWGGTVNLTGPFTNVSGTTLAGGRYTIRGTLRFSGTEVRTNAASLVLNGPGARILNQVGGNALANFSANAAAGQLTLQKGAVVSTSRPFQNAGELTVGMSSLFFTAGDYVQTAGTTRLEGGALMSLATISLQSGLLTGTGYVFGDVVNAARIVVGGERAAGSLYLDGNYTQTAAGVLGMELGNLASGVYDTLTITGTATLNGALQVDLLSGFAVREGDVYTLLSCAAVTGQFATLILPDLGSQFFLEAFYGSANFSLIVARRP